MAVCPVHPSHEGHKPPLLAVVGNGPWAPSASKPTLHNWFCCTLVWPGSLQSYRAFIFHSGEEETREWGNPGGCRSSQRYGLSWAGRDPGGSSWPVPHTTQGNQKVKLCIYIWLYMDIYLQTLLEHQLAWGCDTFPEESIPVAGPPFLWGAFPSYPTWASPEAALRHPLGPVTRRQREEISASLSMPPPEKTLWEGPPKSLSLLLLRSTAVQI